MTINKHPTGSYGFIGSWGLITFYLVALMATAIVVPMCFLGNASGHDFQPHVASWVEAASQWREGIIYPSWAAGANFNFGEPRFVFYPPLSWIIGAALGSIFPWKIVPGVLIWVSVVIAGMAMWTLARKYLRPAQAIAAALFFAANPYHIALIYYRSAFAELLASALFPLVIAGTLGVLREGWSRLPMLATAFALIWLSNAPAAVITTYSLGLLLVVACFVLRTIRPLLIGGVSLLAGFGLAAFYILPAWWEQRWVQINAATSTTYNPEHNFLFTRVNEAEFVQFNWKMSAIAVVLILLTIVAVAFCRRMRRKQREVWWMVSSLSLASILLMVPVSALAWRHLPELRFLQFPWRWLLVLGFAFALFAGCAATRTRFLLWLTIAIVLASVGVTIAADTSWDSEDVPALLSDIQKGRGYEGIEGFQPRGANVDELDEESPLIGEVDPESGDIDAPEQARIDLKQWSAERKIFNSQSDEPVRLALRLLEFPAWQIQVDGREFHAETSPHTCQIILALSAGSHHIEVHFRRTRDRIVGVLVSIIVALGLILLTFKLQRKLARRAEV